MCRQVFDIGRDILGCTFCVERRRKQASIVENRWKDTPWIRESFFVVQKVGNEVIGRCYSENRCCKKCISTLFLISIDAIKHFRPPLKARIVQLGC
jgi:hypothetical protein